MNTDKNRHISFHRAQNGSQVQTVRLENMSLRHRVRLGTFVQFGQEKITLAFMQS